jgi:DNA-binding NtrC family response regulator
MEKRILVIDDEESVLGSISRILKREGYAVDTAKTGTEAIEKSNLNIYNLALIDFRLPDMKGTKLLTAMRETTPRMIKVILTGYSSAENRAEAAEGHADGFIVKPVRIDYLLNIVKEHLRKQDETSDQNISHNPVQHPGNKFAAIPIGPQSRVTWFCLMKVQNNSYGRRDYVFLVSRRQDGRFLTSTK